MNESFYRSPDKTRAHVAIFYRNFHARSSAASHIGLGVNALHTAKCLRKAGIGCDIYPVWKPEDIETELHKHGGITHAIIEAPWIEAPRMAKFTLNHPHVHFVVRAHSQIGFLQVEAGAIRIMRDLVALQEGSLNFTLSANSKQLSAFFAKSYQAHCLYLPNLYDLARTTRRSPAHATGRTLRIASFGALRILKNHATAAAAALTIAQQRHCDLEFFITVNREEHGKGVLDSLRQMFVSVPYAKLHEVPWQTWPEFRRTVAHMDLCIQVSYTETFNLVTADAAAEAIPSVVSSAIEWTPRHWRADVDSSDDVARVGDHLLASPHEGERGFRALEEYVREGLRDWLSYLDSNPTARP